MGQFNAPLVLRPGDRVTFRCQAWDPQGSPLTWKLFFVSAKRQEEYAGNKVEVEWAISEGDIAEASIVSFVLVPVRPYFRMPAKGGDDQALLVYKVLPSAT